MPFSLRFILGFIGTLLVAVYFVSGTLTINNINGPEYVEENETDEVILDCDYDAVNEQDVVLKWFYNGLDEVIFQWIAEQQRADAIGPIKEYLDPTYYVTNDDNVKMFRALKFKKVDRSISGNYTCKVSTDQSDKWMVKPLVVYSPPTSFELNLIDDNGIIVAFCNALNVSPRPIVEIIINDGNDVTINDGSVSDRKISEDSFGYFNESIELSVNNTYLHEPLTLFTCSLSIPGTNYTISTNAEYNIEIYEDSSSNNNITDHIYYFSHEVNSTEEISINGNVTQLNGITRLQPYALSSLTSIIGIYLVLLLAT